MREKVLWYRCCCWVLGLIVNSEPAHTERRICILPVLGYGLAMIRSHFPRDSIGNESWLNHYHSFIHSVGQGLAAYLGSICPPCSPISVPP